MHVHHAFLITDDKILSSMLHSQIQFYLINNLLVDKQYKNHSSFKGNVYKPLPRFLFQTPPTQKFVDW